MMMLNCGKCDSRMEARAWQGLGILNVLLEAMGAPRDYDSGLIHRCPKCCKSVYSAKSLTNRARFIPNV